MSGEADQDYQDAKKRVERKLGFYRHLIVYVVVNVLLTTIDLLTTPDKLWFYWPLAGWGLGLALHGLKVFFGGGSGLKERMIERELSRS